MKCVITVPVYRPQPSRVELLSLLRLKQLAMDDVVLLAPTGLDLGHYLQAWPGTAVEHFHGRYFDSVASYNRLMLSVEPYERFAGTHEWMLVHQLDAFLFTNQLEFFCNMPYDYFGAPWKDGQLVSPTSSRPRILKLIGKRIYVGNGGFSLRRISATIDLLKRREAGARDWAMNEDGFFGYWGVRDPRFRSCPVDVASKFAFEADPEYWFQVNGGLAMGCHAFEKCNPSFYSAILEPIYSALLTTNPALDGSAKPASCF